MCFLLFLNMLFDLNPYGTFSAHNIYMVVYERLLQMLSILEKYFSCTRTGVTKNKIKFRSE